MLWARRRRRRLADLERSTVVVALVGGDTIAGILLGEYDDVVSIARARLLSESTGRLHPLDGEVLIPLDRIRWWQAGVKIDDTRELALAPSEGSRAS